jgi:tetratricopeptide (TPR) repeat protein
MKSRSFGSASVPALIVVAGFTAIMLLTGWIEHRRPKLPGDYEDSDLIMNGSWLRGFAFGTEGLIADWYFMRALQYIGTKILERPDMDIDLDDLRPLNPRLLYPMLQNATDLDPHFIAAYSYGAIVMPAIDSQQAVDLAKKGIANNPDSFRLYQYLGYIYWKLGRFEEAAQTYEEASRIAGAPPFLRLMAASMRSEGGGRDTARAIYRQMLEGSNDEQVRITADRRLKQLDSLDERETIDHALSQFKEKNGRCADTFAEIFPLLTEAAPRGGHELRINNERNLVDPSDAPYLLDREKCRAVLDPSRTGIALQ